MALSFTLFLSGSPQDYEWLPQTDNHAKQVCEKYFNLPSTEIPHSSDFYIELFPADNYSYYTYLHRKAVNGMPREGAHIALTMRISGGYCNQPRTIYDLLEMVYMQYLDGKVIQRKGDGEVFLVPSLMACETPRKQMEVALGQALQQLVAGTLQSFGKEISASRQPSNVKYYSTDTDNEQLLKELRRAHKLRLIPSNESSAEISTSLNSEIDQLKAALTQKDGIIQQKDRELEQLNGKVKELESKIRVNPVPIKKPIGANTSNDGFQQIVLTQLDVLSKQMDSLSAKMGLGGSNNNTDTHTKSIHKSIFGDKRIMQYLPWIFLVAALAYIIINGLREPEQDTSKVKTLQVQIDNLDRELQVQKQLVHEKDAEIQGLKSQQKDNISGIADPVGVGGNKGATSPSATTPQSKTEQKPEPWISVGGQNDRAFIVGKTYPIKISRYDGQCTFTVTNDGGGVLSINESGNLYCAKKGSGTIAAIDEAGKTIKTRIINVVEQ
ncbi:MAG: hypothetical protein IJU19_05330 [Bacteroidales bacterium]|nr:hypothetical protein [Bacteroidales bacterium]